MIKYSEQRSIKTALVLSIISVSLTLAVIITEKFIFPSVLDGIVGSPVPLHYSSIFLSILKLTIAVVCFKARKSNKIFKTLIVGISALLVIDILAFFFAGILENLIIGMIGSEQPQSTGNNQYLYFIINNVLNSATYFLELLSPVFLAFALGIIINKKQTVQDSFTSENQTD